MKDLHDLYTIEYAEENDDNYGRCETCRHYGQCMICGECNEGSNYEFDLVYYQKQYDYEIAEWIKENKIEN